MYWLKLDTTAAYSQLNIPDLRFDFTIKHIECRIHSYCTGFLYTKRSNEYWCPVHAHDVALHSNNWNCRKNIYNFCSFSLVWNVVVNVGLFGSIFFTLSALTQPPFLGVRKKKTQKQILKGPCKLLARSMCAMGHSHTRFIPLVVLIMSSFYLLCKARSTEACNKPAFPIVNLQDGMAEFENWLPIARFTL